MNDKEFLMNWLIESQKLLGDSLDAQALGRMTFNELEALAEDRQGKLVEVGNAKLREAEFLETYIIARQN